MSSSTQKIGPVFKTYVTKQAFCLSVHGIFIFKVFKHSFPQHACIFLASIFENLKEIRAGLRKLQMISGVAGLLGHMVCHICYIYPHTNLYSQGEFYQHKILSDLDVISQD